MVMEGSCSRKKSHKEWRRIAKKERRRRLRRKVAAQREVDEKQLRAALEKTAEYLKWLEQCEVEEKEKEAQEKEEKNQRERLWLEEEVSSQKNEKYRLHNIVDLSITSVHSICFYLCIFLL